VIKIIKGTLMDRSMDIFADMILSFNGEDLFIKASKDSITVTTHSVRSGLKTLLSLNRHHRLIKGTAELNKALLDLCWTL
jgi:hypothetical protein